ncbi:MAG TPA: hypothetical protein VMH85_17185 [Terriglobales bacterium]|nr:hypothetical protein [Terriglobales bacterium]
MRIWNLNEEAGFTAKVVEELPKSQLNRPRKYSLIQKSVSLKIAAGIASLAVSVSIGIAVVNKEIVTLPSWQAAVSRAAPDSSRPLEGMFRDRFDSEWTEAHEESLLSDIVEKRLLADRPKIEPIEIARFVFSNQQENLTLETPRLSLMVVERIVRERKTS